jgi:hypothetical protein
VHQVCAESYALGRMDELSITVVVQIDLSCTQPTLSMTRMTSLTYILLAHCVTNIAFSLSLNSHLQKESERDGHLTTQFEF